MDRRATGAMMLLVLLAAASAVVVGSSDSDAYQDDSVLIDLGNGITEWSTADGATVGEVLSNAAASSGRTISFEQGISVDGLSDRTSGGVTAGWHVFSWTDGGWVDSTESFDPSSAYAGGSMALGFYPGGVLPTETPEHRSSWTMVRGDSANTGHQSAVLSEGKGSTAWTYVTEGRSNYVNAATLVEGDSVYAVAGGGFTDSMADPTLYCFDRHTGEERWHFTYPKGVGYETATGVIAGGFYYLPATNGSLYRIPLSGPGDSASDVLSVEVSKTVDHDLVGKRYATGAASIVYDSGLLYFGTGNGYVYCCDMDLNTVWSTPIGGSVYFTPPTVTDDYVLVGAYDGMLYALDRFTGSVIDSDVVYQITKEVKGEEKKFGSVGTPVLVGGSIMMSFTDGQGMDSVTGGIAVYTLDGGVLQQTAKNMIGLCNTLVLPVENDSFSGIYAMTGYSMYRFDLQAEGTEIFQASEAFKGPITLVNGDTLFVAEYERGGSVYALGLDGSLKGKASQPDDVAQYVMAPVVVIDGMFYLGTDGGMFAYSNLVSGGFEDEPGSGTGFGIGLGTVVGILFLLAIAVLAVVFLRRWRASGIPLIAYINIAIGRGQEKEGGSKVRRNKRRLALVLAIGLVLAFLVFVLSIAVGPSGTYGFRESLSILGSAVGKSFGSEPLTYEETIIFDSRCCRAVAAFAVGIGLSVAGAMYQAIIRNPMVDPYIMGVSAGAGVAAVATIAFDFTFFGLFDSVTLVTPLVAMVGGLIAFACTMLLAEKAGGASINYVLAGIIIGLVFSAIQTLMLSMAGDKLNDAMSWLFGSFANIDWIEAVLVAIPAVAMSLVSLVWAKEFNLVLLGEDQARQMGLDVRRFNRWMLILASVLASVCVAFVGIVGFVGLVVPHLCRMILGGDHRLVLPASMVVGGVLMMSADLFAKMVMVPMELPVGAITTVIGAPVFAYLLIRKGRMYDG